MLLHKQESLRCGPRKNFLVLKCFSPLILAGPQGNPAGGKAGSVTVTVLRLLCTVQWLVHRDMATQTRPGAEPRSHTFIPPPCFSGAGCLFLDQNVQRWIWWPFGSERGAGVSWATKHSDLYSSSESTPDGHVSSIVHLGCPHLLNSDISGPPRGLQRL